MAINLAATFRPRVVAMVVLGLRRRKLVHCRLLVLQVLVICLEVYCMVHGDVRGRSQARQVALLAKDTIHLIHVELNASLDRLSRIVLLLLVIHHVTPVLILTVISRVSHEQKVLSMLIVLLSAFKVPI